MRKGLRYPVYAPITAENTNAMPTYGNGMVVGKAVDANITRTRSNAKFHADDGQIAADNGQTGGTITFGLHAITGEGRVMMFGDEKKESGEVISNSDSAPYGGFGFITVEDDGTGTKYAAHLYYKVQFGLGDDSASTRRENTEYTNPTITGDYFGLYTGTDGKMHFDEEYVGDTEAAVKSWLNGKLNIT